MNFPRTSGGNIRVTNGIARNPTIAFIQVGMEKPNIDFAIALFDDILVFYFDAYKFSPTLYIELKSWIGHK
jgi:hypothetical protein